jgi:hypothetical protein
MNTERKIDLVKAWGFRPLHGEPGYVRDTGLAWEEWRPDSPDVIEIMDGKTFEHRSTYQIDWSIWE